MRSKVFVVLLCFGIILFCACAYPTGDTDDNKVESEKIAFSSLIERIDILEKEQNRINEENKIRFDSLNAEMSALYDQLPESTSNSDKSDEELISRFTYELVEGEAVITGYTGREEQIVIPSHIDGYAVRGIGTSAFANTKITTVIISEGVREIDWFAFYTVPTLRCATLPQSIRSIGYSAFEGASSSFSIYCHKGSFAHSYAESYGIPFVII